MAIKLMSVNGVNNENIAEFIVDTEDEKNNIPAGDKVFGTEVEVVASGKTYRMGSDLSWVEVSNGSGSGGSSGSNTQEVVIIEEQEITGVESDGVYTAELNGAPFNNDNIIVTFDGTDYEVARRAHEAVPGLYYYGATIGDNGIDWSEYPFIIMTDGYTVLMIGLEDGETHIIEISVMKTPLVPIGTYEIIENGEYDITEYAYVDVDIPGIVPTGTLQITTGGIKDVTNYAEAEVDIPTIVNKVTIRNNTSKTIQVICLNSNTGNYLQQASDLATNATKRIPFPYSVSHYNNTIHTDFICTIRTTSITADLIVNCDNVNVDVKLVPIEESLYGIFANITATEVAAGVTFSIYESVEY